MTKLSCAEVVTKSQTVVFERQQQKFLFFERFAFLKMLKASQSFAICDL